MVLWLLRPVVLTSVSSNVKEGRLASSAVFSCIQGIVLYFVKYSYRLPMMTTTTMTTTPMMMKMMTTMMMMMIIPVPHSARYAEGIISIQSLL